MTTALSPTGPPPADLRRPARIGSPTAATGGSVTAPLGGTPPPRTTRTGTRRPAPARRMYLAPVPECEPPFDDERPGYAPVSGAAARWTWSRSVGAPVADWTVPGWCNDADMGVSRTLRDALPDPRDSAGVLARAFIEALAGLRQVDQLRIHCSPEVFAGLRTRVRTGGAPPKLMSVRASEPTDGVAEASAVFRRGQRVAALAFRLQGIDGRWRVTDLQIG